MNTPPQALHLLQDDALFRDWMAPRKAYLTHFFCALDSQAQPLSSWEIGFVEDQKITVFTFLHQKVIIKPADDIFKREGEIVEKLDLAQVTFSWEPAQVRCLSELPRLYPQEQLGNGFVVLQNWQGKTVWSFTFITKSIQFVNVKFNATNGTTMEHQLFHLMQK